MAFNTRSALGVNTEGKLQPPVLRARRARDGVGATVVLFTQRRNTKTLNVCNREEVLKQSDTSMSRDTIRGLVF
jgi:hypothetical protein